MRVFRPAYPLGSASVGKPYQPRKADLERCRLQGAKDRKAGRYLRARYRDVDKQAAYEVGYWGAKR